MPTPAKAAASAHNAAVSFTVSEAAPKPARVEGADGWTITADSDEELVALAEEKLRQAEQNRSDADQAVAHWTAVLDAARGHA